MKEEHKVFLLRLKKLGNGDRAVLRRAAGTMLGEADGKAIAAFYRCLPNDVPQWQESRWFAVACLSCLWDAEVDSGEPFAKIVGRMIHSEELSDSAAHRAEVLLDTAWDEDGYMLTKLTRLVKLIHQKSGGANVDFAALLEDLTYWNRADQLVQREWARSIFTVEI